MGTDVWVGNMLSNRDKQLADPTPFHNRIEQHHETFSCMQLWHQHSTSTEMPIDIKLNANRGRM